MIFFPSMRVRTGASAALLVLASACTLTENGTTVTGPQGNRPINISGVAMLPNTPVRIQVRHKLAGDSSLWTGGSGTWSRISPNTMKSGTYKVTYNGQDWYAFDATVEPDSVANAWIEGGLAKVRAQTWMPSLSTACATNPTSYDSNETCWITTFAFDDINCLVSKANNGQYWYTVAQECKSPSSPNVTLVDTDRVGVSAAPITDGKYLAIRKNPAGFSGTDYYNAVAAPPTLTAFKNAFGFTPTNDVQAIYYNGGDLGFGRDMHCRETRDAVACYVSNVGDATDFEADETAALEAMTGLRRPIAPFATVAMSYDKNSPNGPDNVKFYVYDEVGVLAPNAQLDQTSAKAIPGICLNCHGGVLNSSNQVVGAQFLPFDVFTFSYSTAPAWTLTAQQESFRKLNQMVLATNPRPALAEVVNGLYPTGITNVGAKAKDTFVPAAWAGHETLYEEVVKPYCRTCHIALEPYRAWDTYAGLAAYGTLIHDRVCTDKDMPHAQLTLKKFYESPARAHLISDLGFENRDCRIGN